MSQRIIPSVRFLIEATRSNVSMATNIDMTENVKLISNMGFRFKAGSKRITEPQSSTTATKKILFSFTY